MPPERQKGIVYHAHSHTTTIHAMNCLYTCRKNLTTLTLQSDAAMKALQEKKEKVYSYSCRALLEKCVTVFFVSEGGAYSNTS